MQALYKLFPDQSHRISKLYGAYIQTSIGIGFFVTPFYSSTVTSLFSYETTCDSVAFIILLVLIVFLAIQLTHKEKPQFDESLKEPLIS